MQSQVWYNIKKMLGHAPSKKEIPTLNQNDIPYESSTDKSNLFAENFRKIRKGMTSRECFKNKWFYMKYIGKYLG
jgi:hypothetical protein